MTTPHTSQENVLPRFIRQLAPTTTPDPGVCLPHERSIAELGIKLSGNTLLFTDLAGNHAAFVHGLVTRGVLTLERDGSHNVTDFGKQAKIVLAGDTNDRGQGFVAICETVAFLKSHGVAVSLLAGNHECFLLTFLHHPPVKTVDISELGLRLGGDGDVLKSVEITEAERTMALKLWLVSNGGAETVRDLVKHAKASGITTTAEDCTGGYRFDYISSVCSISEDDFNLARAALRSDVRLQSFVSNLRMVHVDGHFVAVHAGLPPLPDPLEPTLISDYALIGRGYLRNAARTFQMGGGWIYDPDTYRKVKDHQDGTVELRSYNGPLGAFCHSRLVGFYPQYMNFVPKQAWYHEGSLRRLHDLGVAVIARGHDPARALSQERQSVITSGGATILNCEVELATAGPTRTGYTYITAEGSVFAHCGEEGLDKPL